MRDAPPRALRLVFAIGNASRGDDALGPAVAEALRAESAAGGDAFELIEVYQLQVEDALELQGRTAVLFVDAVRPGCAGTSATVELRPLTSAAQPTAFTHALAPAALLDVARRVLGVPPPPAWLLAITGESFDLGAPLSTGARARLPQALALARSWLAARSAEPAPRTSGQPCRRAVL